ncbi:MAG: glycine zipper 2TM domain-containing protein [Gammaproteobacteria bacterium]|nr:glycine zipper 2TM domain-containing protein [Gammaproteobacteria bacterium]MYD77199.1 glycine zipper 2TM domain-containing protein [Gammaproteobacteria bacterium]MYJ51665.1 glycine zipper 2TM domain-containing protein [Gammaproteobacteria bacterium]
MKSIRNVSRSVAHAAWAGLLLSLFFGAALAQSTRVIHEARVVKAEPVYRTVQVNTPVEECWQEPVQVGSEDYSATPAILGAIVGGSVGNEFGKGRGKDVATLAGAILGGSIGHDIEKKNNRQDGRVVYEQRCRTVDSYRTEERFDGYDVTYEYNGGLYTARTANHPGQSIKVSVSVIPIIE